MFLKQVYRHNKWLFAACIGFMALQMLVFSRSGMVFTPFYNYGMYSEVMHPKPQYVVTNFPAVKAHHYTPQQWDKIFVTLQRYQDLPLNDSLYQNHIVRLYQKLGLPAPARSNFTIHLHDTTFNAWYPGHLKKTISRTPVKISLASQTNRYKWTGQKLEVLP